MPVLLLDDEDLGRRFVHAIGELAATKTSDYEGNAAVVWRLWAEMGGDIRPAAVWPIKYLAADLEDAVRISRPAWSSLARDGLAEAVSWEKIHGWPEVWEGDVARIIGALDALPGDLGERRLVRAVARATERIGVREPVVPRRQLVHVPSDVYKQWGWLSALCEAYPQRLTAHLAHAMDGAEHAFARQSRSARSASARSGSARSSGSSGPFGFGWG